MHAPTFRHKLYEGHTAHRHGMYEELSCQMAARGYNDKQIGREPLPFSTFEATARCIIAGTTAAAIKCANTVAELLHDSYMSGYNGEKQ